MRLEFIAAKSVNMAHYRAVWQFTLMMEAVGYCETSFNFYRTTRYYIPEGSHLHTDHQIRGEMKEGIEFVHSSSGLPLKLSVQDSKMFFIVSSL